MSKRKALSKRIRFEVFKRDNFTCQYCGGKAPDVILRVDHINPVAGGGDNEIVNLITSCEPCNQGKGARALDDKSVIIKQRAQLEELNERREQLEMMVQWREGLQSIDEEAVDKLNDLFNQITGRVFSEFGRKKVRRWLKQHSFAELYDALEASASTYWKDPEDDDERAAQAAKVIDYTPAVIAARKRNADKPWMKDLYYARAIVRNRHRCIDHQALELLQEAYEAGIHVDDLKEFAKQTRSWTAWRDGMRDWIDDVIAEDGPDEQD